MTSVRASKGPPLKKGPDTSQGGQSPARCVVRRFTLSPCRTQAMLTLPPRLRRAPAWPNRPAPSPGPGFNANAANRAPANGFPPLNAQSNGKSTPNAWGSTEDKQQLLAGLAGSIVSPTLSETVRLLSSGPFYPAMFNWCRCQSGCARR